MTCFVGIDVHTRKDLCLVALDETGRMLESRWLPGEPPRVAQIVGELRRSHGDVHLGIDAPREPLPAPREWYWSGGRWTPRSDQRGHGRHCEVVVAALGLARPQWTPPLEAAPAWMRLGFELFDALEAEVAGLFEAFPSASYAQLRGSKQPRVTIDFGAFAGGVKDVADACVAAATVRELVEGRGVSVGGGDGLGTIALPRPVEPSDVLVWPA